MILIVIFFVLLFNIVKSLQLGLIGCGVGSLISSLIVKHRMDDIDVTILEKNERVGKHYYY
jgi:hypothetical protein